MRNPKPKKTITRKSNRVLINSTVSAPLDIDEELKVLEEAKKKICANKRSARAFLVKSGFLTKDGKLAARYR